MSRPPGCIDGGDCIYSYHHTMESLDILGPLRCVLIVGGVLVSGGD